MSEKILITGGAGYIGSHTTHYLLEIGVEPSDIVVIDNLCRGNLRFVPKEVKFYELDLLDEIALNEVFARESIDSVIHFAAYAYVQESRLSPNIYYENNVVGGLKLLNAMLNHDCKKIVFSSSCATYGVPIKSPILESDSQIPINPYGESKLAFEKILKWYSQAYNLKYVALRYFNAAGSGYGIGEHHVPETHIIPNILKSLKTGELLRIYGNDYDTYDGTCVRDYTHVIDLASAHYLALKYLKSKNCSTEINLGTGSGTSLLDLIKICEEVTMTEAKFVISSKREGDPPMLVADNSRARSLLGWVPIHTISDIVKSAWEWEACD